MRTKPFFFLLVTLLYVSVSACDYRAKEEALNQREASLDEREQKLSEKEKELKIREEELNRSHDILPTDTTPTINPAIPGKWLVKMTCTETNCPGSAVGDNKTEQWDISTQSNVIIAKAYSGGKLVRSYTGLYTGNTLELVEDLVGTASEPAIKMVVRLTLVSERRMEGSREIVRENVCKTVFTIQMDKE